MNKTYAVGIHTRSFGTETHIATAESAEDAIRQIFTKYGWDGDIDLSSAVMHRNDIGTIRQLFCNIGFFAVDGTVGKSTEMIALSIIELGISESEERAIWNLDWSVSYGE